MACVQLLIHRLLEKGKSVTSKPSRRRRPPDGRQLGRPLTIYFNQPRETRFQEAFKLLQTRGMLPATAIVSRSRSQVIDFALDALVEKLKTSS